MPPVNDLNMSFTYKYLYRNGTLVKTDLEGNELSVTEFHYTEQQTVPIPTTSPPSQGLIGEYNVGSSNSFRSFERLIDPATTNSPQHSSPNPHAPDSAGVPFTFPPSSTSTTLPQSEVMIPTPTSHDHTPNINNLSADMAGSKFTPAELRQRDQNAILYSANLLTDGDTLVFIDYPNDVKTYDTTGFMVFDMPHRVHSQVLRSTGSPRFEKMFSPTYQYRIKRRKNLVHNLGNDIKYVLDLTPPDEGDDALELITSLSCSQGIRYWYTAEKRLKVSSVMVGGHDEKPIAATNFGAAEVGTESSTNKQEQSNGAVVKIYYPHNGNNTAGKSDLEKEAEDLARVMEESRREAEKFADIIEHRDVPEYDPVRHRTGIVRLLQVLEGKAPQLDSAPKVWTLFALAKYFGCEQAVTDHILTWLIAEPNNYFIEILPEVSYRIGFGLKNSMITRATFAILVGQESLSLVSREMGKLDADKRKTTQFGRLIEDVDEDTKTRLEYASRSFTERLNKTFNELAVGPLEWLNKLVSFRNISQLATQTASMDKSLDTTYAYLLSTARDLQHYLREYIRGRIMAVLYRKLDLVEQDYWNKHRYYETYIGSDYPFADVYNVQLSCDERILTAFFWRMLKNIHLDEGRYSESNCAREYICDVVDHDCFITSTSYEKVTYYKVKNAAEFFNSAASSLSSKRKFNMLDSYTTVRGNGQVVSESSSATEARVTAKRNDNEEDTTLLNQKRGAGPNSVADTEWTPFDNLVPATNKTTSKSAEQANSKINKLIKPIPIRLAKGKEKAAPSEPSVVQGSMPLRPKDEVAEAITSSKESLSPFELLLEGQKDSEKALEASRKEYKKAAVGERASVGNASSGSSATSAKLEGWKNSEGTTAMNNISYFNLNSFTRQATEYIQQICNDVLSTREIGIDAMITDTLLCLGPQEFKYLPLWAGGDDDDSGGVFNEDIPTAFAGPNGPGPAFHTGFSSSSQQSGSEYDTCSLSKGSNSGVSTSVAVLDGFSDQLDRRTVVSDDEFGTATINDSEGEGESEMEFSNMGSTTGYMERDDDGMSEATIEAREAGEEDDDMTMTFDENGSDDGTEMGFDLGEVRVTDPATIASSHDEAKSEAKDGGHNSDDDWDIGGDDEAFDFGDSDEDLMVL